MDWLYQLYEKLVFFREQVDFLSPQTILANLYTLALVMSFLRARKRRELYSNFLTICGLCINFYISAFLMWFAIEYATTKETARLSWYVYIAFIVLNAATIYLVWWFHSKKSFVIGSLFFVTSKYLLILSVLHGVLWVQINGWFVIGEWFYYFYPPFVLYSSFAMAVLMFFPSILKTNFRRIMSMSLR